MNRDPGWVEMRRKKKSRRQDEWSPDLLSALVDIDKFVVLEVGQIEQS